MNTHTHTYTKHNHTHTHAHKHTHTHTHAHKHTRTHSQVHTYRWRRTPAAPPGSWRAGNRTHMHTTQHNTTTRTQTHTHTFTGAYTPMEEDTCCPSRVLTCRPEPCTNGWGKGGKRLVWRRDGQRGSTTCNLVLSSFLFCFVLLCMVDDVNAYCWWCFGGWVGWMLMVMLLVDSLWCFVGGWVPGGENRWRLFGGVHTHTHAHPRTHIQTHTHTYKHTHAHPHAHTHTHTHPSHSPAAPRAGPSPPSASQSARPMRPGPPSSMPPVPSTPPPLLVCVGWVVGCWVDVGGGR
jgi:hypothetical protein